MGIAELKPIWCLVGYLTSVRCGLGLRYTQSRASKLARLSYIWLYWEESNMRSEDTKQLQTDHEEKTKLQLLVMVTWLVMQLKKKKKLSAARHTGETIEQARGKALRCELHGLRRREIFIALIRSYYCSRSRSKYPSGLQQYALLFHLSPNSPSVGKPESTSRLNARFKKHHPRNDT